MSTRNRRWIPCSHQAAVAIHNEKVSINCIPTLAPAIPQIWPWEKWHAEKNIAFYASLHDKTPTSSIELHMFNPDFTSTSMDLIQTGTKSEDDTSL